MVDRIPMRDMARQVPAAALGHPVVRAGEPIAVRAWIIDGRGRDTQVDGVAVAWTRVAVHLHYVDPSGREGFVWVWASAVSRR